MNQVPKNVKMFRNILLFSCSPTTPVNKPCHSGYGYLIVFLETSWWKPFLQRTLQGTLQLSYDVLVRKSGQVHLTEQEQYLIMVRVD
jgi:hypothetical protein